MFSWIKNLIDGISELFFGPPIEKYLEKHQRSTICRTCGRKYRDVDSAAICSDWDKVLGKNRHNEKY